MLRNFPGICWNSNPPFQAIANMTNAERVLSDELGRAQYAEAALRRRFLAEDQSARHSAGVNHPATGRRTQVADLPIRNNGRQEELDEIHAEMDTDVDLLGVDGLILDDDDDDDGGCLGIGINSNPTSSLPSAPYTVQISATQSENKIPRSSVNNNQRTKSVRRCCACQCHRRGNQSDRLPSPDNLCGFSKHRSGSLLKLEHMASLGLQIPSSSVTRSRSGKTEISSAKDLTRTQPKLTQKTTREHYNSWSSLYTKFGSSSLTYVLYVLV